jgi:hypothetical protein
MAGENCFSRASHKSGHSSIVSLKRRARAELTGNRKPATGNRFANLPEIAINSPAIPA